MSKKNSTPASTSQQSNQGNSPAWKSKIVGHGRVAPDQLVANPMNWRKHPVEQREALRDAIAEVGFIRSVTVNKTTGNLVDGHERVWQALTSDQPFIDVEYVELTEAEEKLALATMDPIGEMAVGETKAIEALLQDIKTNSVALAAMLDDVYANSTPESIAAAMAGSPGSQTILDQAIQLKPAREYVVVVCDKPEEWEEIKAALELPVVRRGGYKPGSVFDDVGTQRVIKAADLLGRLHAHSHTEQGAA